MVCPISFWRLVCLACFKELRLRAVPPFRRSPLRKSKHEIRGKKWCERAARYSVRRLLFMRLTPRVPRGALALMFFFSSLFFFTNRGTDFARKEGLRLVHLERRSVISYQSFLSGTHTFVFSFSSFQCSVCHTLRSLKVFWNTFTMIFLRVVV